MPDVSVNNALLLPAFDEVRAHLRSEPSDLAVSGLRGAAQAMALAQVLAAHDGPILVQTADGAAAKRLMGDLTALLAGSPTVERLFLYPPFDVAPFESLSPHNSIVAGRMAALAALQRPRSNAVVFAPVGALLKRVVPRAKLSASALDLRVGEEVDRDLVVLALEESGYHRVPLVEDVGEYAVRGAVVDFWSPLSADPMRIELSGDEIASVRLFVPGRQTTRKHVDAASVFACRETIVDEEGTARFAGKIKPLADEQNIDRKVRERLVEEVKAGLQSPGVEFLLPLFYDELDTIAEYLPGDALVVTVEPETVEAMRHIEHDLIHQRHEAALDVGKLCVPIGDLFLDPEDLIARLDRCRQVCLGVEAVLPRGKGEHKRYDTQTLEGLREEILAKANEDKMLEPLTERVRQWQADKVRVALVARSASGVDRLTRLLDGYGLATLVDPEGGLAGALSLPWTTKVPVVTAELSAGAVIPSARAAIVTEEEIFGPRRHSESLKGRKGEPITDFGDLADGDAIVHLKHGIGIYQGLERLSVGGMDGEFVHLQYAGGDKLYLPVDRLSQVQRFIGTGAAPIIDKLGSGSWEKVKAKAAIAIRKMAQDLLKLYAARATRPGHVYAEGGESFAEFEATFPYDETPDQLSAINDTLTDMRAGRPMDRLVCGDVGFGKTEVALRAAFLAVLDGKQVAVLVPTTTLAFQHARTFAARMAPFGVNVRSLSRFVSGADRKKTREELADGRCDVIIGTHQLLGKSIKFHDLGLLIVDEEQLFGVAQKERIKQMREEVDVLTLTATPIPRTLHMSLMGIRDLSVINTPPEDRLAVRTFLTRWDDDSLREAIHRELARGGSVFFIHNRIEGIDVIAEKVRRLAPEARVRVGHGKMHGDQIEELLIDFAEHRYDILVATTIVGSGLDFPQANTMIINRADNLGLAQLYQLRGRVGRSKVRAYCYLVIPEGANVSQDARKRLAAIKTFTDLGSGYKIAAKDMEIRGAGNLLGAEQSGQIAMIGYELYRELLDDEIARLKGEVVEEKIDTEINLPLPAFIPEDYVPEASVRLATYKRIADAGDPDALGAIRDELLDRFGEIPLEVGNLLTVMRIKITAQPLRVTGIDYSGENLVFAFHESTPVTASALVAMVTADASRFRLLPDGRLMEKVGRLRPESVPDAVQSGLNALSMCVRNRRSSDNLGNASGSEVEI